MEVRMSNSGNNPHKPFTQDHADREIRRDWRRDETDRRFLNNWTNNYERTLTFLSFLSRVTVFILLLYLMPATPLYAQVSDADAAMMIGHGLGEALGSAITGIQHMGESAAEASREIEAARRAYWEALRTGRNIEEARHAFAHQLRGKDFLYMWMAIPAGVEGSHYQIFEQMSPTDGGIHSSVRFEFMEWINAIRAQLDARGDRFITPSLAQVVEALEATRSVYEAYIRARNWTELDDSGLTWPWDTDARAHAIMLMRRYSGLTIEQSKEAIGELNELFGEAEVLAAADRVRTARRNPEGLLATPSTMGVDSVQPDAAFAEILATRSGESYFKYLIWQGGQGNISRTPIEARNEFDRFLWSYGATAIEAAANEVLSLPKNNFGNIEIRRGNRASQLNLPRNPQMGVWTLLQRGDPEGRIRAMFAFHSDATSRDDIDRMRQDLEERFGAEAVEAATGALYAFWHLEDVDGPNMERRYQHNREARKVAGLHEHTVHHFYDTDYGLLIRILNEGAVAVLGPHVPMLTDEQRRQAEEERLLGQVAELPEQWQRQLRLFDTRFDEWLSGQHEGPVPNYWGIKARSTIDGSAKFILGEETYHVEQRKRPDLRTRNLNRLNQGVATYQTHADISGDASSDVALMARLAEELAEEVWSAVAAQWPDTEISPLPALGSVPDPSRVLSDVRGTWTGEVRYQYTRRMAASIHIDVPAEPGGSVGTLEFVAQNSRDPRPQSGQLFYVGHGLVMNLDSQNRARIAPPLDLFLGWYSLAFVPAEGDRPTLLLAVKRHENQLDVHMFQQDRRPGRSRSFGSEYVRTVGGRLDPRPATVDLPPQPMAGCPDGVAYEWIDKMPVRSQLTGGTIQNDTLVVVNRRARPGTSTVRFLLAPPSEARNVTATGRDRGVNEATVELIESSRFSPGTHQGRPACVWMEYIVKFQQRH